MFQNYDKYFNRISHGNDKDCALFSRLCLERVKMQKDADAKRCEWSN